LAKPPAADDAPLPPLPPRDPRGHKGTFGTVLVVGGCAEQARRMIGAPALASLGALKAGAGLARLLTPEPILNHAIALCPASTGAGIPVDDHNAVIPHECARLLDEQMADARCIVVGPGLGTGTGQRAIVLRCIQQEEVPVVIDADGLNALAEMPEIWRDFRAAAILTPHPGEYRRLADALKVGEDPVRPESRPAAAEALAQRLGCIVVLKGAGTVVSDGQRTWMSPAADSVLATGGTGDVLAGIVAGLVAQFVGPLMPRPLPRPPGRPLDLFDAARLGVEIHARAAARWKQQASASAGMLPHELAGCIPEVMQQLKACR
jgi:ADP-dependent NAD(P)H-hydrate dehydratase